MKRTVRLNMVNVSWVRGEVVTLYTDKGGVYTPKSHQMSAEAREVLRQLKAVLEADLER